MKKRVTFNLLQKNYPADIKGSRNAKVQALRAEAREYRKLNNDLVEQIYTIDREIASIKDEPDKERLIKEKEQLSHQLEQENYIEKLDQLLKEIRELEIALIGRSDVGGSTPYTL